MNKKQPDNSSNMMASDDDDQPIGRQITYENEVQADKDRHFSYENEWIDTNDSNDLFQKNSYTENKITPKSIIKKASPVSKPTKKKKMKKTHPVVPKVNLKKITTSTNTSPRQQQTEVAGSPNPSTSLHYFPEVESDFSPPITSSHDSVTTTKSNVAVDGVNVPLPILMFGILMVLAAGVHFILQYYLSTTTDDDDESTSNESPTTTHTRETTGQTEESTLNMLQRVSFTYGSLPISNDSMEYLFEGTGESMHHTIDVAIDEKTESKDLLKSKFNVNDIIQVLFDFSTDTRNSRPLAKGMLLRVVDIDANGDLKVRHGSWNSNSWIFKKNYNKIQKTYTHQ